MKTKKFNPKDIKEIRWDNGVIDIFFNDNPSEPFMKEEFKSGSKTRKFIEEIEKYLNKKTLTPSTE